MLTTKIIGHSYAEKSQQMKERSEQTELRVK